MIGESPPFSKIEKSSLLPVAFKAKLKKGMGFDAIEDAKEGHMIGLNIISHLCLKASLISLD